MLFEFWQSIFICLLTLLCYLTIFGFFPTAIYFSWVCIPCNHRAFLRSNTQLFLLNQIKKNPCLFKKHRLQTKESDFCIFTASCHRQFHVKNLWQYTKINIMSLSLIFFHCFRLLFRVEEVVVISDKKGGCRWYFAHILCEQTGYVTCGVVKKMAEDCGALCVEAIIFLWVMLEETYVCACVCVYVCVGGCGCGCGCGCVCV